MRAPVVALVVATLLACAGAGPSRPPDALPPIDGAAADPGPDGPAEASGADLAAEARVLGFPADHPLLAAGLRNIAHRGGAQLRPEETLAAYEHAVAIGADVLEMDLHASADGVVVLHHDATLDRTTDGAGRLADHTLAELKALDAGYRYTPDGGVTYPYRGEGLRIATFEEVLRRFPDRLFSAEIKQVDPPIVDAVLAVLAATGMEDRVILVSFSDSTVRAVRAKNPRVLTGAGMVEMLTLAALPPEKEATWVPPCPFFQLHRDAVTPDVLRRAHAKGVRVQAWTVNDEPTVRALLALGVDGVMSDDPALVERVLQEYASPD